MSEIAVDMFKRFVLFFKRILGIENVVVICCYIMNKEFYDFLLVVYDENNKYHAFKGCDLGYWYSIDYFGNNYFCKKSFIRIKNKVLNKAISKSYKIIRRRDVII